MAGDVIVLLKPLALSTINMKELGQCEFWKFERNLINTNGAII